MKKTILTCFAFAFATYGLSQTPTPPQDTTPVDSPAAVLTQSPTATPTASPIASASVVPTPAATVSATASPDTDEDFDRAIEKKINKHFRINFDDDGHGVDENVAWIAIPIVLIVFGSLIAVPVAVVWTIFYFANSRNRALHKTVRMMVEKGQPVPEALLNPPAVVKQRSDLRRGIVLLMIGTGMIVFFGAVNDWEGGAWSLGMIPFLIGLGYLLFWKLDVRRDERPSPRV